MARPVRIDVEDQWYHVIARGQRGESLFMDKADYYQYLRELQNALARRGSELGAYCLMTNHIHLLIYRGIHSLASLMQLVHSRYGRYFNLRHRKKGYVFQGRYKSFLILDDRYLTAVLRYIHLNPVDAGMVRRVEAYRWSSDGYYRGVKRGGWIKITCVPGFRGETGAKRYRELMDEELGKMPPKFKVFIGEEGMESRLERRKGGRPRGRWRERRGVADVWMQADRLVRKEGYRLEKMREIAKRSDESRMRQKIMARLYKEGYSPSAIARLFGLTPSAVFRAHERV